MPLPDVQRRLVLELCGLGRPYPSAHCAHALAGHHAPDLDLVLLDGRTTHITELLRERRFLLLDLEADQQGLPVPDLGAMPLNWIKARAAHTPASMQGVKQLLIRPDAYVAWAGDATADASSLMATIHTWLRAAA